MQKKKINKVYKFTIKFKVIKFFIRISQMPSLCSAINCISKRGDPNAYIAGYLIPKVEKVVKGPVRRSALFSNPNDPLDLSLANVAELRGKRAITIPSQSVFILIQTAEKIFHSFIVQKLDTLSYESNLLEKVGQEILKVINYSTIFPSVNAQFSSVCVEELVKLIVFRYLKLRFLSFTKVFNQNLSTETSKRNLLNKYTLFMNE